MYNFSDIKHCERKELKMSKKIVIFVCCILLIFSATPIALANENSTPTISPRWLYINDVTGSVKINATTGYLTIDIEGNYDVTRIEASAELYYKNASGKWSKIPTNWEYSSNSKALTINETFSAIANRAYKVVLNAEVFSNGGSETLTQEFTN